VKDAIFPLLFYAPNERGSFFSAQESLIQDFLRTFSEGSTTSCGTVRESAKIIRNAGDRYEHNSTGGR
jgi:hypothetical protein